MRPLLADWRAGGACHCRSASSNGWLGCSGSSQLLRFQCTQHFRTHGGPNYSLKSDRCGVACGTIMRSRPQRPLSSTVRPRKQLFSCVSRSPQHWALRFAHCSCSAFSLLLSLGCAGLRVALGSFTWRARKIMRALLADWRAGGTSHCRRLRRTAGSAASAVLSSVVSNALSIFELTAGLTIRSSRTAAG